MKFTGRTLIQTALIAMQLRGADLRLAGIDPQWGHTPAQPAL